MSTNFVLLRGFGLSALHSSENAVDGATLKAALANDILTVWLLITRMMPSGAVQLTAGPRQSRDQGRMGQTDGQPRVHHRLADRQTGSCSGGRSRLYDLPWTLTGGQRQTNTKRQKPSGIGKLRKMPRALVSRAKKRTGIASDTDLIELANIAVADDYADWLISPDYLSPLAPQQSLPIAKLTLSSEFQLILRRLKSEKHQSPLRPRPETCFHRVCR
jgi:hypothetical protein